MPNEITQDSFGQTTDGKNVTRFTLSSRSGDLVVRILDYGGIITEVNVPDRDGNIADITLGFDNMADYIKQNPFFGALIGRYANRIPSGQFTLDGQQINLDVNRPPNAIHGGPSGFYKRLWSAKVDGDKLVLTYISADGEEHYPGELTTTVTYRVTDDNELVLEYEATTTKPTPVNLTNHAYFNLAGHAAGALDDHVVTIAADSFLPVDEFIIPTGEIRPVDGTEWDLRTPVRIGDRLHRVPGERGFDFNYCLTGGSSQQPRSVAKVEHPPSGRFIECLTTQPGLQFYTGCYLNVQGNLHPGKGGNVYKRFGAFCLETQHYPNSVNEPSFPNTILKPGEKYQHTSIYKFGFA